MFSDVFVTSTSSCRLIAVNFVMDFFKKACALFEWNATEFKAKHTMKQQLH